MCLFQDHLFLTLKLPLFFYLFTFSGVAVNAYYRQQAWIAQDAWEQESLAGDREETFAPVAPDPVRAP